MEQSTAIDDNTFPVYLGPRGEYTMLPYHLPAGTCGKCEVRRETYPKGKKMCVVSMRSSVFMGLRPSSIVLEYNTVVHQLIERGIDGEKRAMWMSSVPQEIEQATRQLSRARGNVLVGGLGLGLAVILLRKNRNVDNIVVVESNDDVIKLVWDHLPEVACLVKGNLFDYLKSLKGSGIQYQFAYYDVWCPTQQWVWAHYVKPLRKLSVGIVPQDKIECWNEEEMLGQTRMSILNRISIEYGLLPSMADHQVSKMSDREFARFRKANLDHWPFVNWMRHVKPSHKEATEEAEYYMAAMKDAERWETKWRRYESLQS